MAFTKLSVVITTCYMLSQITLLYTFSLYSTVCQLYLNKIGGQNKI